MLQSSAPMADQHPDAGTGRWQDLRDWLALLERRGELMKIDAEVDTDEELGAITFMGAQQQRSPAFLFNRFAGNRTDARVLTNMLAASKERYALTVGLDPSLSTAEMIVRTRDILKRRIAPTFV